MDERKVYLDACSWCRPYDDLSQPRIYIESEAVLESLHLCKSNSWTIAASEIIEVELLRIKNADKLENIKGLYEAANEYLTLTDEIKAMAQQFQQSGIKEYDSLHLATAEKNNYDFLLTTDDDFRHAAYKIPLKIKVRNPVEWLLEETENARNNNS
jgi:predicted nucleic acid-binding protein